MDIKKIKALAEILNSSGLTSIEISEGETKISLKKEVSVIAPSVQMMSETVKAPALNKEKEEFTGDFNFGDANEIKSPLVGIFYAAPSPDSEPFVKVGSKVKRGDTLCIIEAMKLMNEISAERDGEIVDICAENGNIIEFGQTIFKMI